MFYLNVVSVKKMQLQAEKQAVERKTKETELSDYVRSADHDGA